MVQIKSIQHQLEFYLSESNYRKDKYLQQHTTEDGLLDLHMFLTFQRMKALEVTLPALQKAASKSKFLTLVNHTYVGTSNPPLNDIRLVDPTEASRTVYIENYNPDEMTHDSLRQMFSRFGKVTHVSLPKSKVLDSKSSQTQYKGFGFLEFEQAEAATLAVKHHSKQMKENNRLESFENQLKVVMKSTWLEWKSSFKEIVEAIPLSSSKSSSENTTSDNSTRCPYTRGLVLQLQSSPAELLSARVKASLQTHMSAIVPLVSLDDTLTTGGLYVRFLSTSHAQMVLQELSDEPPVIASLTFSVSMVQGQEEEQYWSSIALNPSMYSTTAQNLLLL